MTTHELKFSVFTRLFSLENSRELQLISDFMDKVLSGRIETVEDYYGLSEAQHDELLVAIEESYDEKNWVSREEAHKIFAS